MRIFIPLFFILFSITSYSQHTDRFVELTKHLEKIEQERDTSYYKNGNIKFLYEESCYEYQEVTRCTYTGVSKRYYRNGVLKREILQDGFGNYIFEAHYNKKGFLTLKAVTSKIDNRSESLIDFFEDKRKGDFTREINYYKLSKTTQQMYCYAKEMVLLCDGEYTITQSYFDESGTTVDTLKYNYLE